MEAIKLLIKNKKANESNLLSNRNIQRANSLCRLHGFNITKINTNYKLYRQKHFIEARDQKDADKQGRETARTWYGGTPRREGGVYYFNGDSVAVSLISVEELTEEEYSILRKFI